MINVSHSLLKSYDFGAEMMKLSVYIFLFNHTFLAYLRYVSAISKSELIEYKIMLI